MVMDSSSQTILLTGATSGIGLAAAEVLSRSHKYTLLIAARDPARAGTVARRLGPRARPVDLDLASLMSVRAASRHVADILNTGHVPPLRGLVLNAGMQTAAGLWKYTADGFEITFGTNHLGHFLLTNLLAGELRAPARIVVTSSGTHDPDTIDGRFNKPQYASASLLAYPERPGAPRMSHLQRYSTSKLCNLYFAYELKRRLEQSGLSTQTRPITVNAFDPGAVPTTGLLREHGRFTQALFKSPLIRFLGVRIETEHSAGAALARLVTDPTLWAKSGGYFAGFKERRSSRASYDIEAATELWRDSAELVGLGRDEAALTLE